MTWFIFLHVKSYQYWESCPLKLQRRGEKRNKHARHWNILGSVMLKLYMDQEKMITSFFFFEFCYIQNSHGSKIFLTSVSLHLWE